MIVALSFAEVLQNNNYMDNTDDTEDNVTAAEEGSHDPIPTCKPCGGSLIQALCG
jgi:hypothetical protein